MSHGTREPQMQRKVLEVIRAVLSDDHNYELGLASLRELVDEVGRQGGAGALGDLTVALSLELAEALERIARDQGLAAEDLVEQWFAE